MSVIAQIAGGYSIVQILIFAIIIAGVLGIAVIAIRAAGLEIPGWAIQIFWIVVVVLVAIFAIKLLMSMV